MNQKTDMSTGEDGFAVSGNDGRSTPSGTLRLVLLIIAGLIISNVVAALLFERDPALGMDELLVAVAGVGVALLVEVGIFRRRRR